MTDDEFKKLGELLNQLVGHDGQSVYVHHSYYGFSVTTYEFDGQGKSPRYDAPTLEAAMIMGLKNDQD